MKGRTASRHEVWPAERFYWAVLDASVLPAAGVGGRRRRLGYLFERFVPGLDAERLHVVYRRLPGDDRHLACGLQAEALVTLDDDCVSLSPASLPPFAAEAIDPAAFNLLTGRYTPRPVRRRRRRWAVQVAAILAVCAAIIVAGLERRTGSLGRQLDETASAQASVLDAVLGEAPPGAAVMPPHLRLTAELRRLEQTRDTDAGLSGLTDGAEILAELLAHWPGEVHALTEAVSVTESAITIRAAVPSMAEAQRFADSFAPLAGWRLLQPQSEAKPDHVAVSLRLEPQPPRATP